MSISKYFLHTASNKNTWSTLIHMPYFIPEDTFDLLIVFVHAFILLIIALQYTSSHTQQIYAPVCNYCIHSFYPCLYTKVLYIPFSVVLISCHFPRIHYIVLSTSTYVYPHPLSFKICLQFFVFYNASSTSFKLILSVTKGGPSSRLLLTYT